MAYNPKLVEQLLGEEVAKLMDGTVEVIPAIKNELVHGFKVGDALVFNLKVDHSYQPREFIVTIGK